MNRQVSLTLILIAIAGALFLMFSDKTNAAPAVAQWRVCPPNATISNGLNTPRNVGLNPEYAQPYSFFTYVRRQPAISAIANDPSNYRWDLTSGNAGGYISQLLNYGASQYGARSSDEPSWLSSDAANSDTGEMAIAPGQWDEQSNADALDADYPGVAYGGTSDEVNFNWDIYHRWAYKQYCANNSGVGEMRVRRDTVTTSGRLQNGVGKYWALRAPYGNLTVGSPNNPQAGFSYAGGLFNSNTTTGTGGFTGTNNGMVAYAAVTNLGPSSSYEDPESGTTSRAKTRCLYTSQNNNVQTEYLGTWAYNMANSNNAFATGSANNGLCGNPTVTLAFNGSGTGTLSTTGFGFMSANWTGAAQISQTQAAGQPGSAADWSGNSPSNRSSLVIEARCMSSNGCHDTSSHYMGARNLLMNVTDPSEQYLFTDRQNYYGGGKNTSEYEASTAENYANSQNIIRTNYSAGTPPSGQVGTQAWIRGMAYSNWAGADPGLGFGSAAQWLANTSNTLVVPTTPWQYPGTMSNYGWNTNNSCGVWQANLTDPLWGWNAGSTYRVYPKNKGTFQNPSGANTAVAGARSIGFCNNWFYIRNNFNTRDFPDGSNYIYYCGRKHHLSPTGDPTSAVAANVPTLGTLSPPNNATFPSISTGWPSMCHRRIFNVDNTQPAVTGAMLNSGTASFYGGNAGWIRGNVGYNITGGEVASSVASGARSVYGEAVNVGTTGVGLFDAQDRSLWDKTSGNSSNATTDPTGNYDNQGIITVYGTQMRVGPIPGCGTITPAVLINTNCSLDTNNGNYNEGDLAVFRARANDNAGNARMTNAVYRRVDNTPPAIAYAVTNQGAADPGIGSPSYSGSSSAPSTWYTAPVDLHALSGTLNSYGSGGRAVRFCTNTTLQANCTVPTTYSGNDIAAGNRIGNDNTSAAMGAWADSPAYTISSPTRVALRGEDLAGNLSSEISFTAKVDLNNPSVNLSGTPSGWTNAASVAVTAQATDSAAAINSGVAQVRFSGVSTVAGSGTPNIAVGANSDQNYTPAANGSATSTQNRAYSFTNEGNHTYRATVTDASGRSVNSSNFTVQIDRSLPTSSITMPVGAVGTIINGSSPVTVAASDQALLAGVNQLRYSVLPGASQNCGSVNWATASDVPVGAPATNVSGSVNPPAGTTSTICVRSTDAAGNVSAVASSNVTVDNSLPTLTVTGDNPGSWSNVDLSVTANANDTITGIASLARNDVSGSGTSQNTGTTNWVTSPNTLRTWNGTYSNEQSRIYNFIATDGGGNTASDQVEINIDKTAPTVSAPAQANVSEGVQLTATASDQATLSGAANGRFEFCTLSSKANCDAAPIGSWDTANAWASGPNACTGGDLGTGGGLSGTGAHPNKTYTCVIGSTTPKNASGNVYVRLRARDNAGNEAISTGGSIEVAVPTTVCKLIYYKD